MQKDRLVDRIASQRDEPDVLRKIRSRTAERIPQTLSQHLADQFQPRETGRDQRRNVSDHVWEHLQDALKTDGARLTTLHDAAIDQPSIISDLLPDPGSPLQTLCQAYFTNGVYIELPDGARIDTPLQPVFSNFASPQIDMFIVNAGDDVAASFIEGCSSPRSTGGLRAGYTLINAGKDSRIRHGNLQHWRRTTVFDTTRSTGDGAVATDHFIQTDRGIIEADTPSRAIIGYETGITGENLLVTLDDDIEIHSNHTAANTAPSLLENLPNDYRTEIKMLMEMEQ